MKNNKIIELKNVSAGYNGETIIEDVSLEIFGNDFIGVIGPNGAGKTTLIKTILRLITPYKGEINYFFKARKSEAPIGYLPQVNTIDNRFPITVKDVIMSGLLSRKKLIKRFTKEEKQKADILIKQMKIEKIASKPIGELSGGQMQRVFLCRAIISDPELLILDEPNTFVDNKFESELYEILKKLNEKMAIVVVSHDIGTISTYVKTIACVNRKVHYHKSNIISQEQLDSYNCPIQLITHGHIPHTVLESHREG
jgi:zinc transport system ATP-binding protein